jgi:hypothetical protein
VRAYRYAVRNWLSDKGDAITVDDVLAALRHFGFEPDSDPVRWDVLDRASAGVHARQRAPLVRQHCIASAYSHTLDTRDVTSCGGVLVVQLLTLETLNL